MAAVVLGLGLLFVFSACSSAAPATKTFDQRQQGELNIHAHLDNIVIVLIPTSKISLMDMAVPQEHEDNLVSSSESMVKPEKNGFLHFLQKHIKNDIDRFGVVKGEEETSPNVENEVVSQSQGVALKTGKDKKESTGKEDEVVAMVEEMKPSEVTEKMTETPKQEGTEDTPIKEHSTVSETVQETVIKVSIPGELKDAAKKAEEESKKVEEDKKKAEKESIPVSPAKPEPPKDTYEIKPTVESSSMKKETTPKSKHESSSMKESPKKELSSGSSLEELIKPLASKERQASSAREEIGDPRKTPVEGFRKEKTIRYKPESKWAPGLVDLLGPVRPRSLELEDRQRFSPLCTPGVWDSELKTCIMPGETRSRNELARFLEAMRFGIALPSQ